MTDQTAPVPEAVSPQSGISRYVLTNEETCRTTAEASQWGLTIIRDRDMDTKYPIRQSVFIDWSEGELIKNIIAKHGPR